MINVLCVCGNGMGTSTIMKISIKNICDKNNIDAEVESCSFGEARPYLATSDVVITSPEWSKLLPDTNIKVIEVMNLMDKVEIERQLVAYCSENGFM